VGPPSFEAEADTWEWNGKSWSLSEPVTSPSARYFHAMALDSARQEVVLFGGTSDAGAYFADTWTWDGTAWTEH
jgi:hypothetical protein